MIKKVSVSKRTWRCLGQIKKDRNLNSFPATVKYLIGLHQEKLLKTDDSEIDRKNSVFLQEKTDISDIGLHVDALIKAKNLGETPSEKQHSIPTVELQCLQCSNIPFPIAVSDYGDTILCPFCGFSHSIAIYGGE